MERRVRREPDSRYSLAHEAPRRCKADQRKFRDSIVEKRVPSSSRSSRSGLWEGGGPGGWSRRWGGAHSGRVGRSKALSLTFQVGPIPRGLLAISIPSASTSEPTALWEYPSRLRRAQDLHPPLLASSILELTLRPSFRRRWFEVLPCEGRLDMSVHGQRFKTATHNAHGWPNSSYALIS